MCGIAGVFTVGANNDPVLMKNNIVRMTETLVHRGPDDAGVWIDEYAGISLGHRRLSIVDLSAAGHQPMKSANGRYVLVYNGEIYNFEEIHQQLAKCGIAFRGHSDTEVLLEGISQWGLENTLIKCNGMFAFALWDRDQQALFLARDRVGKKPLYYGWCGKTFLFGSELKALKAHSDFHAEIDRQALGQYIQYSWINGPATIYQDIHKLVPGTYIKITKSCAGGIDAKPAYWSLESEAQEALANPFSGSYDQAQEELKQCLSRAVKQRMVADVELGSLLSGGIDSSLVTALMQSQSTQKIKTFSIGFHEATHNEAEYAKKVAQHLGTDHTELYVTPQECLNVIPNLPTMYDEPFADASQIPTYLVSKLARNDVKVVLTGDGGDELFVGYTRYFRCLDHWQKQKKVPFGLRNPAAIGMEKAADLLWQIASFRTNKDRFTYLKELGVKLEKRARRLDSKSAEELFVRMMVRYKVIEQLVVDGAHTHTLLTKTQAWPKFASPLATMTYIDFKTYLVDDILVKLDRASMAASLEARSPILDREVIKLAWALPLGMKVNEHGGKRILKDLLAEYVPTELTDRKKMGFGVPIDQWLRGPLREWAEDLLDERMLKEQAFFAPKPVRKLWQQHLAGWRGNKDILWSILMFQAWRA